MALLLSTILKATIPACEEVAHLVGFCSSQHLRCVEQGLTVDFPLDGTVANILAKKTSYAVGHVLSIGTGELPPEESLHVPFNHILKDGIAVLGIGASRHMEE